MNDSVVARPEERIPTNGEREVEHLAKEVWDQTNLGFVLGRLAAAERASEDGQPSVEQIMRLMGEKPLSSSTHRILAGIEELVSDELIRVSSPHPAMAAKLCTMS